MFENCFFSHTFFPVFAYAEDFNGDISSWQTGAVTDMSDSKL
jgi:surface protein